MINGEYLKVQGGECMLSYYSRLSAEVYDMDKPVGHSFGDIEFYKERLKEVKGPVLEPAAGTGRFLIPLLESGIKIEGFDVSPDMLEICRGHCEKRGLNPVLYEAEMASFTSDKKYDAIIVPTGTFLLLHERDKSLQALVNFKKHLKDGGKLILDLIMPGDFDIGRASVKTWECANGDVITHENKLAEVNFIHQYTVSHGRYEKWRNGTLMQTELERFPLRWYGVEEFRLILEQEGFQNIIISSNYEHGRYPEGTDETITFEASVFK